MSQTPSEVRVAGAGSVYVAAEGTALPTDLAALPAEWVEMGYVTPEGVAFTHGRETEDLDAWQGSKIRVLTLSEPVSVAFALMQTNQDTLLLALGGGSVTTNVNIHTFTPPSGSNEVRAMVIEFTDGSITYRYCLPRVQVEGEVSYTLTNTGAVTYPIEFGVLDNTPKFTIVTDDSAMGTGSL